MFCCRILHLSFFYITFFYSNNSVLEPNPVLYLTPPSTIVSDRLTWSITNCCVCLRAVCKEHAWWNDLCRSWLQRHHQSLAMRIRLPFALGTSGNAILRLLRVFFRELASLLLVCNFRVLTGSFSPVLLLVCWSVVLCFHVHSLTAFHLPVRMAAS